MFLLLLSIVNLQCGIVKKCECKKITVELAVLLTNTVRTAVVINIMCVSECVSG